MLQRRAWNLGGDGWMGCSEQVAELVNVKDCSGQERQLPGVKKLLRVMYDPGRVQADGRNANNNLWNNFIMAVLPLSSHKVNQRLESFSSQDFYKLPSTWHLNQNNRPVPV